MSSVSFVFVFLLPLIINATVFQVTDDEFGAGEEAVHLKVLQNTKTKEYVSVVWDFGGRVEELWLQTPSGNLRKVLDDHNRNATAVRANLHWKGEQLVPYANRIADATYVFNGTRYYLPMNEPARNNSIHGLLWDRTLDVVSSESTDEYASVVLSYAFNGTDRGYPFLLNVTLTYTLSLDGFRIDVSAVNVDSRWPLPFYNSWHPYFLANASLSTVTLDQCAGGWNHVDVYNNSNFYSNLIPTGSVHRFDGFDGSQPIGGSWQAPTYYDDEFKPLRPHGCYGGYRHTLSDPVAKVVTALWSDAAYPFVQVFTGSMSLWGVNAVVMEPMSAKADAFNNNDGLHLLSANETFVGSYGVRVEDLR